MLQAAILFGAYVLGGIPFGLAIGKIFRGIDLRQLGSKNIGASNAWRVLGWKLGLPIFLFDLGKGLLPVFVAQRLVPGSSWVIVGTGICAILGHNFSPFLRFKGGKGVATSLGVAVGLSPVAGLCGFAVWGIVTLATRFVSLGSLIGTPVGAVLIWWLNGRSLPYGLFSILATLFVVVKHAANIKRLLGGTEARVSFPWEADSDRRPK